MFKLLACSDLHLNQINGRDYFRPRTKVEELRSRTSELTAALDNSGAMFAVHCGDMFDLSRYENRTSYDERVAEALREYNSRLNIPGFYLPGNSDATDMDTLADVTKLFLGELSNWNDLEIAPGTELLADYETGNFAFQVEGCLIVGLNSYRPRLDRAKEEENKDFLRESLKRFNGLPVIVFTHHNPFETSNPDGFPIFPRQSWIIDYLTEYNKAAKVKSLVVCGHCHKWFQSSNTVPVQKLCLAPMSPSQGFYGAVITVENKDFSIQRLTLARNNS